MRLENIQLIEAYVSKMKLFVKLSLGKQVQLIMKYFLMCDLFLVKIFIRDYLKDMRFSGYSKFCSWIRPDHLR